MKRKFVVQVELSQKYQELLETIRWKHIDIDKVIEEELQEQIKGLIRAYGEVV